MEVVRTCLGVIVSGIVAVHCSRSTSLSATEPSASVRSIDRFMMPT
jgi:hypothetical protein